MTISELIEELKMAKEKLGDVPVVIEIYDSKFPPDITDGSGSGAFDYRDGALYI